MQTDGLNLATEIGSVGWPWTTSLDVKTDGLYGLNLCGPILFNVYNNNGGQKETTDLVVLTPSGDLVFQPTTEHQIKAYDMLLCGHLEWY